MFIRINFWKFLCNIYIYIYIIAVIKIMHLFCSIWNIVLHLIYMKYWKYWDYLLDSYVRSKSSLCFKWNCTDFYQKKMHQRFIYLFTLWYTGTQLTSDYLLKLSIQFLHNRNIKIFFIYLFLLLIVVCGRLTTALIFDSTVSYGKRSIGREHS